MATADGEVIVAVGDPGSVESARSERAEPDPSGEPTFADVLNNLVLEPGRHLGERPRIRVPWGKRARQEKPPRPDRRGLDQAGPAAAAPQPLAERVAQESDDWADCGEPEDLPARVRPYARTGGRTSPVHHLAVETLVATTGKGRDAAGSTDTGSVEHLAIVRLCEQAHSVAEVSALLGLPLGAARVLLADMVDAGLVEAYDNPAPDLPLLERVLAGLRRL